MREMLWVQRRSDSTCVGDLPARETGGSVGSGFLRHYYEPFASGRMGDAGDPERPPLRVSQSLGKLAVAFVAV